MAREQNYAISQLGKTLFLDLVNGGAIDAEQLITTAQMDKAGRITCLVDGVEIEVKVKVKTTYEFHVDGDPKYGTGWPLESANKARAEGGDFYMVFMDYKSGQIFGGIFLDIIEPRSFDSLEWPYHYNAAGQQVELYSIHLLDRIGWIKPPAKEELLRLAILNRKADKDQIDIF